MGLGWDGMGWVMWSICFGAFDGVGSTCKDCN